MNIYLPRGIVAIQIRRLDVASTAVQRQLTMTILCENTDNIFARELIVAPYCVRVSSTTRQLRVE